MLGAGQGSDQGSHLTSGLFITWAPAAQACSRADYGCESLGDAPVSPKGMSREEGLLSSSPPAPPPLSPGIWSPAYSPAQPHMPLQAGEPALWGLFLMQRLGVTLKQVFRVSRGHLTSSELKYPLLSLWLL